MAFSSVKIPYKPAQETEITKNGVTALLNTVHLNGVEFKPNVNIANAIKFAFSQRSNAVKKNSTK